MSNLGEMRTEVLGHQFSTNYSDRINKWINEALQIVHRKADIRRAEESDSISTVGGTNTYSLPDDFVKLTSIRSDAGLLRKVDISEFDDLALNAVTGKPTHVAVYQNNFLFWPTPDAAYTISVRYHNSYASLTADNQSPDLPDDYHYLLEEYALMKAYAAEHDQTYSDWHKSKWDNGLQELIGELQSDVDQPPTQVPGGWELGYP
jgi:hypothetical protein